VTLKTGVMILKIQLFIIGINSIFKYFQTDILIIFPCIFDILIISPTPNSWQKCKRERKSDTGTNCHMA